MKFLVHHDGKDLGPYSLDEVRRGVAGGSFLPSDLAWQEGAPEWLPLSSIPGATLGAEPAEPSLHAGATGVQASGLAMASLVLGIFSVCGCMLFLGIPAVICGHLAFRRANRAKGPWKGEGLAVGGLITGYLGTVMTTALVAMLSYKIVALVKDAAHSRQSLAQSQMIAHACHTFATDHGGKFPGSLEDLVPDYLEDQRWLADPGQPGSTEIGYFYYGSGHFETENHNQILLASKAVYSRRRAVVRFNAVARLEAFNPPIDVE
jgi:Domain of unknown function (DUF4190)/GYF domain 2